jgi:hypothetical protein
MQIYGKNRTPASRELNQVDVGRPQPASADPSTMNLTQKLQDPKVRDRLVQVLGEDLVDKLDKIFNPRTMPGAAQENAMRDMMEEMKSRAKQGQPQ